MYQASLPQLRGACKRVLVQELRPMHYVELAKAAYSYLGIQATDDEFIDRVEDLREKVFDARSDGFGYTGKPSCFVVLGNWFRRDQLFNSDTAIRIPITTEIAKAAATEAQLRSPYMLNKFKSDPEDRAGRISHGFLIQEAVCDWARKMWPKLYLNPLNYRKWREPCNHDFRIDTGNSKVIEIDVAGIRADGYWGAGDEGKRPADYHLIADIHSLSVELKGVQRGSDFNRIFGDQQTNSIHRFVLVLNCFASSVDFRSLAKQIEIKGKA